MYNNQKDVLEGQSFLQCETTVVSPLVGKHRHKHCPSISGSDITGSGLTGSGFTFGGKKEKIFGAKFSR